MHVYLRDEPVALTMRQVDGEGMVADADAGLVPIAFFADGNERPSFRALLPPETLSVLRDVTKGPVQIGVLAEEPDDPGGEVRAMVGLSIPAKLLPEGMVPQEEGEEEEEHSEPWRSDAYDPDAWRGEAWQDEDADTQRTVLLAFAPLVRLARRHPHDFGEELADLLESALAGNTRPSLEARVDRMLGH
ncbi:MAG TPA: hypothetical protein VFX98_03360 [Longimicrobiaceae bacterium]|nr:hypothetical protein [Longimicrobiaceae bacterium]